MNYNPQRVMRQFGYDQGTIIITEQLATSSDLLAESIFVSQGKHQILAGMESFFWPGLARVGVKLPGGALYWQNCIRVMKKFVKEQDEAAPEVPLPKLNKKTHFHEQGREWGA